MTLSRIVTLIIEEFLPEMYRKYQFENYQMSEDYRAYNDFVPKYLRGRPPKVIRHCMERNLKAKKYVPDDVCDVDAAKGQFCIKSSSDKMHKVDFGAPSCECKDWIRFHMPCKHFFAVFLHRKKWQWSSLPQEYLLSAYLSQDSEALSYVQDEEADQERVCTSDMGCTFEMKPCLELPKKVMCHFQRQN